MRLADHRRIPRHPRDRAADQARAVQHLLRETPAPGPPPPLPGSVRTAGRRGSSGPGHRDPNRCGPRRRRSAGKASRPSRSASSTLTSTPSTSGSPPRSWAGSCPVCRSSFPPRCPRPSANTSAHSTTVVNAAIAPVVSTYLGRVETKLRSLGLQGGLYVMQSNGGVCTFETARRMPVQIIESGPAAGVTVAAFIGSLTGCRNVISLDIGGTTAKAGLIQDGAPRSLTSSRSGPRPPAACCMPRRRDIRSSAESWTWWRWAPAGGASAG